MKILAPVLLLGFFAATTAQAGGSCQSGVAKVQRIFEDADTDQSGSLTLGEYEEAGLESWGLTFEQSDLDGDGETSLDEYLDLYEAHHPPADQRDA